MSAVALAAAPAATAAPGAATAPRALAPATFFGGYHTVAEQYQHIDDVATAFPNLATSFTYGSSWLRTQGPGGRRLRALCLSAPSGDPAHPSCAVAQDGKPKFILLSAIHAREIVTGEITYRFIDWLTTNYGFDPMATAVLDNTAVWIVPQANPDGSEVVASRNPPILQRKNLNNTAPGSNACLNPTDGLNGYGVDLNRNFPNHWAAGADVCGQTFPGQGPASEPETQGLITLMSSLAANFWSPVTDHPLFNDANAVVLSLHSFGNVTLYPWEFTNAQPDPQELTRLSYVALRMAKFTDWTAGQPASVLGANASGGLEDWAFNGRGLPAFAWEIGGNIGTTCGGFTPAFSCVTGFFNQALPALLYTASIAPRPWHFGVGPRVTGIQVTAVAGQPTMRTLRITANDRLFGPGGVNAPATPVPPVKTIDRVQYLIDAPPGDGHAHPVTITSIASDGTTTAQATISVAGLAPGRHLMYARSHTDQNGPYTAVFFTV